jgi:alkylhydroperoxidase family enzyme
LVRLVRSLVLTRGEISADEFRVIKAAGYTDAQLVEISLAMAVITFTNVFNRINDTTLDFPAAA